MSWCENHQAEGHDTEHCPDQVPAPSDEAVEVGQMVPLAEVVEALREYKDADFAGVHVVHPAKYIERRFAHKTGRPALAPQAEAEKPQEGPRCKVCQDRGGPGFLTPCPGCNLYPPLERWWG